MEGEIRDCAVLGELPRELHGTLYRNGPNPQFAPPGSYHFFFGDGMVHAFHFEDGRCSYRNRWVRTPRFEAERAAGRPLFGNLFAGEPTDPAANGVPNGPANTNIVWHGGKLLALVEGGLEPVELDPDTLETRSVWDFAGRLRRPIDPEFAAMLGIESPDGKMSGPFTAHPKLDPETGQMLAFGYSVFPPYLTYYEVSAAGVMTRSQEVDAPFPSMVHDFLVTQSRVLFPIFPATLRPERAAEGGSVLGWEPDLGTRIGVMQRRGDGAALRWFETDPCYVFHPLNAYEDGDTIVLDVARLSHIWRDSMMDFPSPELWRWTIDTTTGRVDERQVDDRPAEFPRVADSVVGLPHRYGYLMGIPDNPSYDDPMSQSGSILKYDRQTGARTELALGRGWLPGEAVFVPADGGTSEDDGYLMTFVYDADSDTSRFVVVDAGSMDDTPIASVELPRIPFGFHGNWIPTVVAS